MDFELPQVPFEIVDTTTKRSVQVVAGCTPSGGLIGETFTMILLADDVPLDAKEVLREVNYALKKGIKSVMICRQGELFKVQKK